MKERVHFWDNYKGILIFLVVFGHFIYSYAGKMPGSFVESLYVFIYSFHMPAFIFCSGYFSKSENSRSKESLIKLLLYYFAFNALMGVFAYLYMGTKFKFLTPYYSYWYILALVMWRFVIKPLSRVKCLLPISVAVALLIGYFSEFTNEFAVRRMIAFFPFFVAGYMMDRGKVDAFLTRRKTWQMAVSAVLVLMAAVAIFFVTKHYGITDSMTLMSAYNKKSNMLHRLLIMGIAVVAIVGMFLCVPNRHIPLLSKMGKNSLLVYLGHRFLTLVYYRDLFHYSDYNNMYLVYALVATLITCMVLSSDILNRLTMDVFNIGTKAVCDPESQDGNYIITVIVVVFLIMLCVTGVPATTTLLEKVLGG